MAFASPNIMAFAVEATEFPDLARLYQVSGVPKTIVTAGEDQIEILGALPQDAYIDQALDRFTTKNDTTVGTESH